MRTFLLLLLLLGGIAYSQETFPRPPALSPEQAVAAFQVLHGFRMELLAAEPLVTDPVAMAYDEDGRAYVCEMNDYPYTDKANHRPSQVNPTDQPIGKVRLLTDDDGDGRFDRATVFAEGLSWPTGVACWKGGVFVAATPDVWYFKDTNADGVADVREKVFTGFNKLNVQAVMNNLVWGLDNRIYGAGGSNGGEVRAGDSKPLLLARNDFAFEAGRPAETLELLSGGARFGNTFDDWGNRFLCNIRNPAQHVVLPSRYLARNAYLPVRSPLHDVAESGDQVPVYRISPVEPWREVRARRWAGERDTTTPRSELVGAGVVTSSSGVTVYRGSAYPPEFRGNIFTAESAGNLFYRQALTPKGVTFTGTRVDGKQEMVASKDLWFRPVNFVNAPDGTLHVCDMYREVIEHPWSIPDDIHAALDLESGRDKGRLWRLAPPGFKPPAPPRLGKASAAELVAALENPNSWWRETAQRLLFERQDAAAVEPLRALLRNSKNPLARLHALYTLHGMGALQLEDLRPALADEAAGVRAHAVCLAEEELPALIDPVQALARDADARVRFQVALTLGETPAAEAAPGLAEILRRDAADEWIVAAALSSAVDCGEELLRVLATQAGFPPVVLRQLAALVGARGRPVPELPAGAPVAEIALGFGEGLKKAGKTLRAAGFAKLLDDAQPLARDSAAALPQRQTAILLLGYDDFEKVRETLGALLVPREPQEIQQAALQALSGFSRPEVGTILLQRWAQSAPSLRPAVVQALLGVKNRLVPFLDAIDRGEISKHQIPPARRALLLRGKDPEIKARVEKLFAENASPRSEVVAKYQAALKLRGDPARGRKIYETNCQICHRLGAAGNDIGPNLGSVRQWSEDQLLVNILDPNREVAPNYLQYAFELKNGETVVGLLADETPASLTVRRIDNVTQTVLRRDLQTMTGLGVSLMPEGIEAAIGLEQMADLLAAIKAGE
jgi:putative membrane-bound dehydrogenase-like protein